MKKASSIIIMLLCSYIFIFTGNALAIPLNGEYSINVFTQQIDEDSWFFKYDITNNNQQIAGKKTGLDSFKILLPETAIITDVTIPSSYYGSPGSWGFELTYDNWIRWWGYNTASTYPIGTTASFSFYAHNVTLGETASAITSYWNQNDTSYPYYLLNGGKYTDFNTTLLAPVAYVNLTPEPITPIPEPNIPNTPTPEPGTVALLGVGLCGLGIWIRKSTRKA